MEEKPEPWFEAAQKRLDTYKAHVTSRKAVVESQFGSRTADKIETRLLEIIHSRGLTELEISKFHIADRESPWGEASVRAYAERFVDSYRHFYDTALKSLNISLMDIGNTSDSDSNPWHPITPDSDYRYMKGNRKAIEAAILWLDHDMDLFNFYEDLYEKHLGMELEVAARSFARSVLGSALFERGGADNQDESVALTAAQWPIEPTGRGKAPVYSYADRIAGYPLFSRFERMARWEGPYVKQTSKEITLVEAARRIELHITELYSLKETVAGMQQQRHSVGFDEWMSFYDRHITELERSLWLLINFRFGADPDDLNMLDAGMTALKERAKEFPKMVEPFSSFEVKSKDLKLKFTDLDRREAAATADKEDVGALYLQRQELNEQEDKIFRDYEAAVEPLTQKLSEERLFTAIPGGKVHIVRFRYASNPMLYGIKPYTIYPYPIPPPPDVALGVPLVLFFELDAYSTEECPKEQIAELRIGAETLKLKVHLEGSSDSSVLVYRTDPFVLRGPGQVNR